MVLESLTAVRPVDGRFRSTAEPLADYFSEYALMKMRVTVECEYLMALSETKGVGIRPLTADEKAQLPQTRRSPADTPKITARSSARVMKASPRPTTT